MEEVIGSIYTSVTERFQQGILRGGGLHDASKQRNTI